MNSWKERMRKRIVSTGKKYKALRAPVLAVTILFLVVYHSVRKFLTEFLYHPVRHRVTVGILVAAFLAVQLGNGFVFADKEEAGKATILSFSKIERNILSQKLETGADENDIVLPEKLKAKVEVDSEEDVKAESAATGSSVQAEETDKEEKVETVSVGVAWKLVDVDTRSGEKKDTFDGNAAGTYRYRAALSQKYEIAEDCELPIITVTVEERTVEEENKEGQAKNNAAKEQTKKKTSVMKGSARLGDTGVAKIGDTCYDTLQEAIDASTGGTESNPVKIEIISDMTLADKQEVYVRTGKHVQLVSSGKYTIKRADGLQRALLIVEKESTLVLGSTSGMGTNTLALDGGAVWTGASDALLGRGTTNSGVKSSLRPLIDAGGEHGSGGSVYLYRGVILQNNDCQGNNYGSAITAASGACIYLRGGIIQNNYTVNSGGAIKMYSGSRMYMTDGRISGNSANNHGGGIQIYGGDGDENAASKTSVFEMSGGVIKNNRCKKYGGGITVSDYSDVTLSGDAMIIDNSTDNDGSFPGGGVAFADKNTSLKVSGSVKIFGNIRDGKNDNLHVGSYSCNKVSVDSLDADARIGVTHANGTGIFTKTTDTSYRQNFFSDNNDYTVKATADGELEISAGTIKITGQPTAPNYPSDKEISVTATGSGTLSYQWYTYQEGGSIERASGDSTKSTYTLPDDLDAGEHFYYCAVSDGSSSDASKIIKISVAGTKKTSVTYNYRANGGDSADKKKASVADGGDVDLSVKAFKDGWTFVGWNTDVDATQKLDSMQAGADDIVLYAIYKKTLEAKFYSGNSRMTPVEVTIYNNSTSGKINVPALEARTGETAVGYTSRNTGAVQTNPEARAGEQLTLKADESPYNFYGIYEKTISIDYNSNGGGTAPAAQTAKAYTNIGTGESHSYPEFTLGTAPVRKGYAFSGWREGSISGDSHEAGGKLTVEADTTFYADWNDNIQPDFGRVTYNDGYVSFLNWIIRKSNLIVTVPVTEEGSGINTISYVLTPAGGSGAVQRGTLDIRNASDDTASDGPVSVAIESGKAEITLTLDSDFKGTVSLSCEDVAGNTATKTIGGSGGGVIVEDNAPDIAFSAGSGSSLTDENEDKADVLVHVADNENEKISGGIKEVTYTVTNDSQVIASETVTNPDFSADLVPECGFTVRLNVAGENILRVTATDNAGNTSTRQQEIRVKKQTSAIGTVGKDTYQGANSPVTNLLTGLEDLRGIVLSAADIELVNKGLDIKILLSVEDATGSVNTELRRVVENSLGNYLLGQYLDISLFKVFGLDSRNKVNTTGRPLRIQITIPDSLKNTDGTKQRTYAIMRVHDDEAVFLPDLDNQEDTITIDTDLFSPYVIVYRDTENPEEPTVTDKPGTTERPGVTEAPNETEQPDVTEEPDEIDGPDETDEPDSTEKSSGTKKTGSGNSGGNPGPETGDRAPLAAYGTLAAVAAILFLFLNYRRKKEQ